MIYVERKKEKMDKRGLHKPTQEELEDLFRETPNTKESQGKYVRYHKK